MAVNPIRFLEIKTYIITHSVSDDFFTLHETVSRTRKNPIGPNVLYRNIRTGPRQEKEPRPVDSTVLVQFVVPIPVPFPCSVNMR